MQTENITKNPKKMKHVLVYDQIYQLIQDGVYTPGSQLPSEPDLAEQFHVSRMTLRKALALLQEDHLVKNIRGKGNFIRAIPSEARQTGMEVLQHPIYACSTHAYEHTEMEFRIEIPTMSVTESLKQNCAAVVITDRWYHYNGRAESYTLSYIPIEVISQQQIHLNQPETLKEYLETDIYQNGNAASSICQFAYTTTGNFTAAKYMLSQSSAFFLIQETIYDNRQKILVYSKHYIPVESFEMYLTTREKKSD